MPGTLEHSQADVIKSLLVLRGAGDEPGSGTAAPSWPVYLDAEPDKPDQIIVVRDTQGEDFGRTQPDGEREEYLGIQVMVRAGTHRTGFAKAQQLAIDHLDAVLRQEVMVQSALYCVHAVYRKGNVLTLGKAPNSKRSKFTVNAVVSLRQIA